MYLYTHAFFFYCFFALPTRKKDWQKNKRELYFFVFLGKYVCLMLALSNKWKKYFVSFYFSSRAGVIITVALEQQATAESHFIITTTRTKLIFSHSGQQ